MKSPKIHIIDDDTGLSDSLGYLFDSIKLSHQKYNNPSDFLETYKDFKPGCILLDVRMPEMSGLNLQDILIQRNIRLPIIFMSGHADIDIAVRAMRRGAFDFFTKPFNHELLLEVIQNAFSHSVRTHESDKTARLIQKLTNQEHRIIEFIVEGKSSKDMAETLNLSKKTIEYHRAKIMQKLSLPNSAKLIQSYLYYLENYKHSL